MKKSTLIVGMFAVLAACNNRNWESLKPAPVPLSGCDTSGILTFSANILPIMQQSCGAGDNSCHSPAGANAGLDLSDKTSASGAGTSGQLIGCITGNINYSAMPKSPYSLSECDKNKIMRWVNTGMQ